MSDFLVCVGCYDDLKLLVKREMERIKTLFIFILFLENGIILVQSENILEELLLSVNHMEANMETVMHKVENIEKAIKDTETKVSTIVGDIKTLKYVKYEVHLTL